MQIWVDADACPNVAKEILFRVANRVKITVTLVANQYLKTPPSKYIKALQVSHGFDEADNEIVRLANADDLAVTSDIPLAAELMEKGVHVLNPRGEMYAKETIKQKLQMRDMMEAMRNSAVDVSGGQSAYGQKEKQAFANALDRHIARYHRKS